MKRILSLVALGGAAVAAVAAGRRSLSWEVRKRAHVGTFDKHDHQPIVHEHEHPHITHNRRQGPDMVWGEWEHLTSMHVHGHNHPALSHAHLPHEDMEHEHLGEAHVHDHAHPSTD